MKNSITYSLSCSCDGSEAQANHAISEAASELNILSIGNIAKWNKQEGDEIAAGDSIAEIETDKATMDWEAQDDGFVAKILVEEGAKDISVGQPVLVIVEEQVTALILTQSGCSLCGARVGLSNSPGFLLPWFPKGGGDARRQSGVASTSVSTNLDKALAGILTILAMCCP